MARPRKIKPATSNETAEQTEKEENLVKKTCRELGITQKELAERIGVTESGLKTALARNNLSDQMKTSIELLIENNNLRKEAMKSKMFQENLRAFLTY